MVVYALLVAMYSLPVSQSLILSGLPERSLSYLRHATGKPQQLQHLRILAVDIP